MALLLSAADGNFTTAATWGLASDGTGAQQLNAANQSTGNTTSYVWSPAFTGTAGHVIDGIMMCVATAVSGTTTVALSDDNGVTATREVTVNCSDLTRDQTWVFFKFSSTLTLDGGTDYKVGIKGSSSNVAFFARNSTVGDWARALRRTTAPGSVAAGDSFIISGEWTGAGSSTSRTITMDSTAATDYGTAAASSPTQSAFGVHNGISIGQLGTLTWAASAATNYILRLSGNLVVGSGGTYNQGTVATPCPRDSTMLLEFDCAADGDFGFLAMNGSTVNIQGLSRTSGKNIYWTLLNTDEAANSTSLGVADDTGWLDNDRIAVASTTRTRTECEAGTLNGAAGASTLTVDGFAGSGGGLLNAHSGTSPTQAEVILLTRNVKVQSVSSSFITYCYFGATATADIDWCEFRYIGENATNKRAIDVQTTTGSFNMQYCSVHDTEDFAVYVSGAASNNFTIDNNVFFNVCTVVGPAIQIAAATTGTSWSISNNIAMLSSNSSLFAMLDAGGVFTGNRAIGAFLYGIHVQDGTSSTSDFSSLVAHSCTDSGFAFNTVSINITMSNITAWRCNAAGLIIANIRFGLILDTFTLFGNSSSNISISAGYAFLSNGALNGDTSFATNNGVLLNGSPSMEFKSCDFSTVSGIKTAHTQDFAFQGSNTVCFVELDNCKLGAATEVNGGTSMGISSFITSSKHDQTAGAYKTWKLGGTIERDTTVFNTAAPSERLTPTSASVKLIGSSRLVAVDNTATKTISVYVRKSVVGDGAAYNGAEPRLILKRNDAVGITSDTVLDTMTAAAGSWEQLSATTAAATDDGAFEVYVDCDGTAGFVNVDDWTAT